MICDECETVAHCLKNGCVPKQPSKDEALKMALEALEQMDGIDTETECVTIDVGDVMDAIKQALNDATHLAAPYVASQLVQESRSDVAPVSITYKEVADTMNALWGGTLKQVQIAMEMADKKLYATPPAAQPALKPLTDEEIMKVWQPVARKIFGIAAEGHSMDVYGIKNASMILHLARAIEAAHGIKGAA